MADYCNSPQVLTLTLGGVTLDLMDANNGFRISELDLGFPDVREDVDPRADAHGTVDLTRLFGARAVTISGSVVPSAYGSRQKSWHALAPFLDPAARPTLTWQVDADVGPRTLVVRATQVTGPYNNPAVSQFQIGFKAPDPRMYDANVQQANFGPSAGGGGRAYNLTFPRVYPAGGYAFVIVRNYGDVTAYPLINVYGPATNIYIQEAIPGNVTSTAIVFLPGFVLGAGNYVELNCRTRTAFLNGDPGNSVYGQIGAGTTGWPFLPPNVNCTFQFSATNTATATQCQMFWQDAYLI